MKMNIGVKSPYLISPEKVKEESYLINPDTIRNT